MLANVVHRQLLNLRVIEQVLLQRIGEPHGAHHDVFIAQRRIERRVQAQILQRAAGRNRDGHAAHRAAARRLRRVEVGMRIEPQHADSQRPCRSARSARIRRPCRHRRTGRVEAHREESVALVPGHDPREIAERPAEALPRAVLGVLSGGELRLVDANGRAHLGEQLLMPPLAIVFGPTDVPVGENGCLARPTRSDCP